MRTRLKLLSALGLWLLGLAACVPATPTGTPTSPPQPTVIISTPTPAPAQPTLTVRPPGEKVTLYAGYLGKPDTLNPAFAVSDESYMVFDLVYSSLTKEGPDGEYVGDLAREWRHSVDGLIWTFVLKNGIRWHDGGAFQASDMAWSINAVIDRPDLWASMASYTQGFKRARALDERTLEIRLSQPVSNMEYRLSFLFALPRRVFENYSEVETFKQFNNERPIGTSAFKLNSFDLASGALVLDANADFYDGRPSIDRVSFRRYASPEEMLQGLQNGEIDMITDLPFPLFDAARRLERVRIMRSSGRSLSDLIINSAPAAREPAPNRNPALLDPQVRLAMAHAINKQELVSVVLQGLGRPGTTVIPPTLGGNYWHNTEIEDVPFDLQKARRVLEVAGYLTGEDGVRAKGDTRLEMRLEYLSDSPTSPKVAEMLVEWFKQIGIKLNVRSETREVLSARLTPGADFDLVLWGWTSDPDPDFILNALTSEQFVEGGWNDSGYSNPEYDRMYREQQSLLDHEQRRLLVWKMQEVIFKDRPYIVYWYQDNLQAYRTDRFMNFLESSALGLESVYSLRQVRPVQ